MKKAWILVVLVMFAIASMAAGCGGDKKPAEAPKAEQKAKGTFRHSDDLHVDLPGYCRAGETGNRQKVPGLEGELVPGWFRTGHGQAGR